MLDDRKPYSHPQKSQTRGQRTKAILLHMQRNSRIRSIQLNIISSVGGYNIMKLPIADSFSGIISSTLARTGGLILFDMLKEAAERAESLFNKDPIPESFRVGATYSHVVATKEGSYCFTLQRGQDGVWSLTSFQQEETIKPLEVLACQ